MAFDTFLFLEGIKGESTATIENPPLPDKASIIMRKATGTAGKQVTFLQYDFTHVMVDSIQWSGSSGGDDTPQESVSFSFATVFIQNYLQGTDGKMSKGAGAAWDLTKVTQ